MTLCIGQMHRIPVYRTVFGVCAVLVLLSVIMCCFHCFLDRDLFHHYFHHDRWGVTIIGIFIATFSFWTTRLGFPGLSISGSSIAQLPGRFRSWTFSLNIGLNMLTSDSFMSCLHSLLGYSTGEFQDLQLIVLAAFNAVDQPFASWMLVHILEI